jgi:hypothetical protein
MLPGRLIVELQQAANGIPGAGGASGQAQCLLGRAGMSNGIGAWEYRAGFPGSDSSRRGWLLGW